MKASDDIQSYTLFAARKRGRRSQTAIAIVAVLFVLAAFLTWYATWFGYGLNDEQFARYLSDNKNPSHVQHALLQVENRIEMRDPAARRWYGQIAALKDNPTTEIRKTAAWVMGNDNSSEEFHVALLDLLRDKEPIVRWNAAVQLARFNDKSGRPELDAILKPYLVVAPATGAITGELQAGNTVREDALLARIVQDDHETKELRSPLPGRIEGVIAAEGARVESGSHLFSIAPDESFVYEALRALVLVGETDDLPKIRPYTQGGSNRIREQAALTVRAIESRASVS